MTPLSKGGSNWPENIACACVECNQLKSNRGAIAFWNLLKKKHGEGRVKEAKEIAERQKLAKAEISQRRKLKEKLKVKS
jgi:5-methylcytosine-specific restriction endonuclease McrA